MILFDKDNNQLWINIENIGIDILDINSNEVLKLRNNNSPLIGKEFNNIIKDNQQTFGYQVQQMDFSSMILTKKSFNPFLEILQKDLN